MLMGGGGGSVHFGFNSIYTPCTPVPAPLPTKLIDMTKYEDEPNPDSGLKMLQVLRRGLGA